MDIQQSEWLDKVRQQFDFAPYPRVPLEKLPHDHYNDLFVHSLVTPHYLRDRHIVDTHGKYILDVGCGSGYKSLILAIANPGAHVVGVDLSDASVELARLRFQHHGFENAEFHALSLKELPSLGLQFDYINCDEVLYLLPEPVVGLQAMRSVLKPDGIIRSNLHSYLQRDSFYRAQDLFRMMGLMDGNPEDFEIDIVKETMSSLRDNILLKVQTWGTKFETSENSEEVISEILMNHLFQEDKGYTISQLFAMFEAADLEFINMVDWQSWQVANLFSTTENLPDCWKPVFKGDSVADTLQLYELLHPTHRLLDFWCGLPNSVEPLRSSRQWDMTDWQTCVVRLHPQLQIEVVKDDLVRCTTALSPFEISRYITMSAPGPLFLDSSAAIALLPLWDDPQSIQALVDRYQTVRPPHPVTLQPISPEAAFAEVQQLLRQLEQCCYVLLEASEGTLIE
ncbi:MAG TPA: class I SAM-dependent methyltransferase [Crinalium sp.]